MHPRTHPRARTHPPTHENTCANTLPLQSLYVRPCVYPVMTATSISFFSPLSSFLLLFFFFSSCSSFFVLPFFLTIFFYSFLITRFHSSPTLLFSLTGCGHYPPWPRQRLQGGRPREAWQGIQGRPCQHLCLWFSHRFWWWPRKYHMIAHFKDHAPPPLFLSLCDRFVLYILHFSSLLYPPLYGYWFWPHIEQTAFSPRDTAFFALLTTRDLTLSLLFFHPHSF